MTDDQPPAELLRPHRRESWMLVGFLAGAAALWGFVRLASEVAEGDTFALDKAIMTGLRTAANPAVPIGPSWVAPTAVNLTALGSAPVLTLITVLAVGYLFAARKQAMAVFVAAAVAAGALLSVGAKAVFERPRPEIVPHLVEVTSSSFPSGHAMNSAIVYLTLAVLIARSQTGRSVRVYLVAVGIVLTLMVGCTRVLLGVHWPSDVLAGWAAGAAWAALCSLAARQLQRSRTVESPG